MKVTCRQGDRRCCFISNRNRRRCRDGRRIFILNSRRCWINIIGRWHVRSWSKCSVDYSVKCSVERFVEIQIVYCILSPQRDSSKRFVTSITIIIIILCFIGNSSRRYSIVVTSTTIEYSSHYCESRNFFIMDGRKQFMECFCYNRMSCNIYFIGYYLYSS